MSNKRKTPTKPAAPQVKKSKTPSTASAKPAGAKVTARPVSPRTKTVPPKPVVNVPSAKKVPDSPARVESVGRAMEEITITAQIDVGFGNQLFIRGEGAGLSWTTGLQMECAFDDQWTIKLTPAYGPVTFKLLMNDLSWSDGENFVAHPGAALVVTPLFN